MAFRTETDFVGFLKITLLVGRIFRLQNWQIDPLIYPSGSGNSWDYMPFVFPNFEQKLGEDASSLSVTISNACQEAAIPLRELCQPTATGNEAPLLGAFFDFTIVQPDAPLIEHTFVVAEREFQSSSGTELFSEEESSIVIKFRQPDDGDAICFRPSYNVRIIGPGVTSQ